MKRDHHKMTGQPQPNNNTLLYPPPQMGTTAAGVGGGGNSSSSSAAAEGKAKMWAEDGMDDELLAVLGYRVKSSDMADVAQKLEMALGSIETDDAALSHLSDTVHYNPSDISGWLETIMSEINPPASSDAELAGGCTANAAGPGFYGAGSSGPSQIHCYQQSSSSSVSVPDLSSHRIISPHSASFEDDLRAIVAGAGFHPPPPPTPLLLPDSDSTSTITTTPTPKRIKSEPNTISTITTTTSSLTTVNSPPSTLTTGSTPPPRPLLVTTPTPAETGVRLVHTLLACAEAIQSTNLQLAETLVKQIGHLALSQSGSMRKVATYFAEALARRIYKIHPHPSLSLLNTSTSDQLQSHFYETCPYIKFAHFTANQAILEAFSGAARVHVVDFSMKQGMQWPALIQALALREGGPPVFRLTGIGPPQPDGSDKLQEVGWKLASFASTVGVQFHYRGFVCDDLSDLEPGVLGLNNNNNSSHDNEEEVVAVNSMFELHRVLSRDGAIEKVLHNIRGMKPKVFTVAEQDGNHNASGFLERFNEALHYYSTMFDSLEGSGEAAAAESSSSSSRDVAMSEVYLGSQICNVVACEGAERVERHERLDQWRTRLQRGGFEMVSLGSNAFKQVSMLLNLFAGGDGFKVEENRGCLTLGWHTRPLVATSAWRVSSSCY